MITIEVLILFYLSCHLRVVRLRRRLSSVCRLIYPSSPASSFLLPSSTLRSSLLQYSNFDIRIRISISLPHTPFSSRFPSSFPYPVHSNHLSHFLPHELMTSSVVIVSLSIRQPPLYTFCNFLYPIHDILIWTPKLIVSFMTTQSAIFRTSDFVH